MEADRPPQIQKEIRKMADDKEKYPPDRPGRPTEPKEPVEPLDEPTEPPPDEDGEEGDPQNPGRGVPPKP